MSAVVTSRAEAPAEDPRTTSAAAQRRLAAEQRLENKAQRGFDVLDGDKWYSVHAAIRGMLRLAGLYDRGHDNAAQIVVRENAVRSDRIPESFDGYTLLQISDLHVELHEAAIERLIGMVADLDYDLVVLTGDYRARTHGPFDRTMDAMAALRARLRGPAWGILGNHDSIRMVPELEALGFRILLNERTEIVRNGERIWLAGVDDDNHFSAAEMSAAAAGIPPDAFSIVLSHTPETYREAAAAGFSLLLAGHTHGGQIRLPGDIPLTLAASGLPRRFGLGSWRFENMEGYTSAGVGCSGVPVRFNCPPEITLHRLTRSRVEETAATGRPGGH